MLPDVQDTMEQHSHLPQAVLQSKAVLLGPRDPCSSLLAIARPGWQVTSRLCMNVISPGPGLMVTGHASGRFSPHKPLAALETQAQLTLENFLSLTRVENSLRSCRLELELSASDPGRKSHAVWLGSKGAFQAGRCFQVLTKAVGMRE